MGLGSRNSPLLEIEEHSLPITFKVEPTAVTTTAAMSSGAQDDSMGGVVVVVVVVVVVAVVVLVDVLVVVVVVVMVVEVQVPHMFGHRGTRNLAKAPAQSVLVNLAHVSL